MATYVLMFLRGTFGKRAQWIFYVALLKTRTLAITALGIRCSLLYQNCYHIRVGILSIIKLFSMHRTY